jgi:hypothetical protein
MERMTRNTVDVDKKYVDETIGYMEAEYAQGKIEAGLDQQERLDEVTEHLKAGEFHRDIDWDAEFWGMVMLLARCVDGRVPEDGANPLAPNAAGGTETIFVADDLTTKRYASEDGTTAGGYRNVVEALRAKDFVVGGHTGSHAEGEKSDCGANDRLEAIYAYMADNPQALRGMAAAIGVDVSQETHDLIIGNAGARTQFSTGKELLGILEENAREEFVDKLHGDHKEVVAVINKRAGTTLDRDALRAEFGEEYEAFNVDAWAFEEAARATSFTEEEVQQKVAAMVYYNLATTMVLVGKKMRIVTLD